MLALNKSDIISVTMQWGTFSSKNGLKSKPYDNHLGNHAGQKLK